MKNYLTLTVFALFLGIALAALSPAKPPSREESQRQAQVIEQLKKALAAQTNDAVKFAFFARVMKDERDVDLRRRILDNANQIRCPDLERFLTNLLASEEDAGLRSQAARTLGQIGSEKCLATLAQVARNDRVTRMQIGCVIRRSSARRAATFAIAELATRFPKLADKAAAKVRALPVVVGAKDNEGLADARVQALYQITHDKALLKPYYEQLKSANPLERARGVASFRFLKLKEAPAEIIDSLNDTSPGVRGESASVLGEIRDPKSATALMRVAGDTKEEATVRCNAIYALGRMKTAKAADLMEKMLTDPKPIVQANAAIALYRITGKKVKQFPEGYNAD